MSICIYIWKKSGCIVKRVEKVGIFENGMELFVEL